MTDRSGSVFNYKEVSYGSVLLCLTVFLLPFPRFLPYWTLILFMLAGLMEWIKRHDELLPAFKKDTIYISGPFLFFFVSFILVVIQKPHLKSFSDSFLYLLVPVLGYPFFSSPGLSQRFHVVIKWFIAGILVICLFEFLRAVVNSVYFDESSLVFNPDVDHDTAASSQDYFSSKSRFRSFGLVAFSHPYYLAFEVVFAIFLLWRFRKNLGIKFRYLIILFLVLSVYLFQISSRSSFIAATLILIYYISRYFYIKKKSWILLVAVPVIIFFFFSLSMLNQRIREKTEYFIEQIKNKSGDISDMDPRLLAWITSAELIRENPLTGLGFQARDSLYARYEKNGYAYGARLKINPHSQFLESQLAFGIPGTLVLLWLLLTPLIRKPRYMDKDLYLTFLIIVITGSLFASFLFNNWGTLFFVLFYCLIVFKRNTEENLSADMTDKKGII